MWRVEFRSDKFLPTLPELEQQNPGVYGFELAYWLAQRLSEAGMSAGYPVGEDWGWFIEHIDGDAEVTIGCGSVSDEGDGYRGLPISWRVFVRQPLSLKQRFKGQRDDTKVAAVAEAVVAALRAVGESVTLEPAN